MLCNDTHDCQGPCPFVRDSNDPNRYICLKCGLVRRTDRAQGVDFFLLFIVTVVIVVLMFAD